MHILLRLCALFILLLPFLTGGCVEVLDPDERDAVATSAADAGVDGEQGSDELYSEVDWVLNQSPALPAPEQGAAVEADDNGDGDDSLREEEIEARALSEEDITADVRLVVDENAPQIEIRQLLREEGSRAHYLAVSCHDPQESMSSYHWVGGSRISDRCDIDLATAVRAVTIEPTVDYRIAPTPRGFRILGDFSQGDYDVTIAAGLRTKDGSVLHEKYEQNVSVPALSKSLTFEAEGRYLPRTGWDNLRIRHRNVDDIDFEVRHIPPANLAYWISSHAENVDERTSTKVVDTEIALRNEEDEILTSEISVADHLGEAEPGLYQLRVNSDRETATSRVQVTDLNLITKRNEAAPDAPWEEYIDVWAVHMETTQPVSGTRVRVIRPSGSTMARCRTDDDGHCQLELPEVGPDETPPMAIIAQKDDDLTYLKFDDVRIEEGDNAVNGPSYLEEPSYRATLYGDRDLYRPGDIFHLVGALRDVDFGVVEAGIPAEITIRDSQGKIVAEETKRTDDTGVFELSMPLSEIAPTGRWRAELNVGTRRVENYSFNVEEFVPERLEVSAEPTKEVFIAGEEATFEVEARYLFGASAEGSPVELNCRLVPVESSAGEGSEYSFGPIEIDERRSVIDLSMRRAIIGEDDTVEVACPKPQQRLKGPMRVEATVAVSEGGSGRTTNASARAEMHPSAVQIGLRTDVEDLVAGEDFVVRGKLVDTEGNRVEEEGMITLEYYNVREHRSWQYDSAGRYRLNRDYELILERVGDAEVKEGRFAVESTTADVHNAYLIRARYGDARSDLKIDRRGRYWSWSGRSDRTPQARRPTQVTIKAPDELLTGSANQIVYNAPFEGRALLTVETDRVIQQRWVEASEGDNQWDLSVDVDEPNVYVSAFIVRDPRDVEATAFSPERAFGSVSVPVESTRIEQAVTLGTPEEVRPGQTLRIEVDAGAQSGPAVATVAAVDEGILQLTNYRSPNPVTAMWTERTRGVETFDTIGWATQLPPADASSRTGGGGSAEEEQDSEGRIMPFRPVALWSGPVKLDENGRATVEFEVPNYSGRLRVMTSVFGPEKMGAAEADVLVRDPLTVQTTFPRHLTVDDQVRLPVFLTNLTDRRQAIEVELAAQPHELPGFAASHQSDEAVLEFLDGATREIELDPSESTTLYFSARALKPGGAAAVTVSARSDEHHTVDEGTIPFRPKGPRERIVKDVALENGSVNLSEYLAGWVPSSEESVFFVSALPEPQSFDNLDYLIRYPHGCAEQTVSSTRPMVFLRDLVEGMDPTFAANTDLRKRIDAGIDRILSMQTSSGAFRFWPGATYNASMWVAAYATHFLMDVVDQGHSVPHERLERATEWLATEVDGNHRSGYPHYVLALAGEPQTAKIRDAIDGLSSNPTGQEDEDAYMLKAALYLAGDRSFSDELQNPEFDPTEGGRSSGWSYYSHQRRRAMKLSAYAELFGQQAGGAALARAVSNDLRSNRRRYTTQELVWGITALGHWHRSNALDEVSLALDVGGRDVAPQHLTSSHNSWAINRASEMDDISLSVDRGEHDGDLSMMIRSYGVREDPTAEYGGDGLEIERVLLDENGDEIGSSEIAIGDVVYVRLRLKNTSGQEIRHLAMVDRLPAGLEVENPDLGAAELPSWAQASWETDHINTRDDRIELFGTIDRGSTVQRVYPTRATLSGVFHVPELEAEGMYEPDIWARTKGGELSIVDPRAGNVD